MKTKVLEVAYGFGYGGIRAFIMNSLENIDLDKFDVEIYVFGFGASPFAESVRALGMAIHFEPENINPLHIPRFVSRLRNYMEKHGPFDVVHAHCNLISAWVLLAAKLAGVPIRLSHSHSTEHFYGGAVQRAYSFLRRCLVNFLATTKIACGQLAGEKMYGRKSSFVIVNNGIDVERFMTINQKRIKELRKRLDIPEGVKVYMNVTRLDPPKNHIFAVEVFNEIHKIEPDSIFVYGGTIPKIKPTLNIVQQKVEEYGLQKFVRYTGPVGDIEQLYHLSDLWIYCSAWEGLPFGLIELQAASTPCLASDVITKEVDLGLGGVEFMSLNESPKEWARKAVSMKKRPIDEIRIRKAFKEHHYDIKESVKTLSKLYQGAL